MSKARLVLTALFVDRQTPAEVARRYSVHRSWVYRLKDRYEAEGEAAFEPRSRRPTSSPTATPRVAVDLIVLIRNKLKAEGHDAGPATIAWYLDSQHRIRISPATVARKLAAAGLVVPQPQKRPRSSYVRFEAEQPNGTWQSDFTHYRLADGLDVEILTWLDDHSRYLLHVSAHRRVTGPIVLAAFRASVQANGVP